MKSVSVTFKKLNSKREIYIASERELMVENPTLEYAVHLPEVKRFYRLEDLVTTLLLIQHENPDLEVIKFNNDIQREFCVESSQVLSVIYIILGRKSKNIKILDMFTEYEASFFENLLEYAPELGVTHCERVHVTAEELTEDCLEKYDLIFTAQNSDPFIAFDILKYWEKYKTVVLPINLKSGYKLVEEVIPEWVNIKDLS